MQAHMEMSVAILLEAGPSPRSRVPINPMAPRAGSTTPAAKLPKRAKKGATVPEPEAEADTELVPPPQDPKDASLDTMPVPVAHGADEEAAEGALATPEAAAGAGLTGAEESVAAAVVSATGAVAAGVEEPCEDCRRACFYYILLSFVVLNGVLTRFLAALLRPFRKTHVLHSRLLEAMRVLV